jgi:hypothetical protein
MLESVDGEGKYMEVPCGAYNTFTVTGQAIGLFQAKLGKFYQGIPLTFNQEAGKQAITKFE